MEETGGFLEYKGKIYQHIIKQGAWDIYETD